MTIEIIWKMSPKWANGAVQIKTGSWMWVENKPVYDRSSPLNWAGTGQHDWFSFDETEIMGLNGIPLADLPKLDWLNSYQARPVESQDEPRP